MTSLTSANPLLVDGLTTVWLSDTELTIFPGIARDVFDDFYIKLSASVVLDSSVSGANGLDTGSITANTLYFVYVIANTSDIAAPATLLSLSYVFPTLPTNYNTYRRVGLWYTDGSSNFSYLIQSQISSENLRAYTWGTPVSVLTGGTSTSFSTIDSSAGIPGFSPRTAVLFSSYTPLLFGNVFYVDGFGPTYVTPPDGIGAFPTVTQEDLVDVTTPFSTDETSSFVYKVATGDSLDLSVVSFSDFI